MSRLNVRRTNRQRQPYRKKAQQEVPSTRCHGGDPWALRNRLHAIMVAMEKTEATRGLADRMMADEPFRRMIDEGVADLEARGIMGE